jgi:hypothetical protein
MSTRRGPDAVYEIIVLGALGPVLRAAIEPCRTTTSGVNTIVRLTRQDEDLVEMVRELGSAGLEVTDVLVVD